MMDETQVSFYDHIDDKLLKFAVILTKTKGKWVLCKHKDRETYEVPGGHREIGETIFDAAKRELFEETGAVEYDIMPVCVYAIKDIHYFNREKTFGMLYFAEVNAFEKELHNEIEKVLITDDFLWQ